MAYDSWKKTFFTYMQIIFCHNKIIKIDLVRLEKEYNTMKSKEKEDEIELRVREAAKKVPPLVVPPLRPYPTHPSPSLSSFLELQKVLFT